MKNHGNPFLCGFAALLFKNAFLEVPFNKSGPFEKYILIAETRKG
jgi:hypothetical protein